MMAVAVLSDPPAPPHLPVLLDSVLDLIEPENGRLARWEERLAPWTDMAKQFREEGFYERFAAKGEVERVARVHRDLARAAGIEIAKKP